jgi:hypothetical protein
MTVALCYISKSHCSWSLPKSASAEVGMMLEVYAPSGFGETLVTAANNMFCCWGLARPARWARLLRTLVPS